MRRIVAAAAAIATALVGGVVATTPPAQATLYQPGCSEDGTNRLDLRKDVFKRAVLGYVAGIGSVTDYEVKLQTQIYYCQRVIASHKILTNRRRVCVTKLDGGSGHNDWANTNVRKFMVDPYYDTVANYGENPIDPGTTTLIWDGEGPKGASQCGPWYDISIRHWMLMSNKPFVTGVAHVDINNASDDLKTMTDMNTGSNRHMFSPDNDDVMVTKDGDDRDGL